MSTTTVVVMVAILGFVWGGLAFILVKAIRKEREKGAARAGDPTDAGEPPSGADR